MTVVQPRREAGCRGDGTGDRPIRVLHIITRMIIGGAQENTMLSCALIDRDWFPSEILSGVETGPEGELFSECRQLGVPVHFEPTLIRPWTDLVCLIRLVRFLRRGRYDVVHTHIAKAGILGRLAGWIARTPVVIHTAHGWHFHREEPPFIRWVYITLERLCAPLSDAIVVVGTPDRTHALALGIGRPEQYMLIRSGIEIEQYRDVTVSRAEACAHLGIPPDAFVVGTVGRITRQKAPLDLFAGFERLAEVRGDAHLVFVGDGPLRPDVEAAAARAGLSDRVHVAGMRRDVAELQSAFDVFALASRWEGLPRVLPQAMAAGLPIVATRAGGAVDVVTDGENGWLVPVGDTHTFGERLIALASDRETARRMGEAGRRRAKEFSARRMVDQLSELYATHVDARRSRRRPSWSSPRRPTGRGCGRGWESRGRGRAGGRARTAARGGRAVAGARGTEKPTARRRGDRPDRGAHGRPEVIAPLATHPVTGL